MSERDDAHGRTPDGSEDLRRSGGDSNGASKGTEPGRIYVLTKGLSEPRDGAEVPLDLITLIASRGPTGPDMPPEHAAIVRMCRSPLSVAEISAYIQLPFSALKVILAELVASGRVEARAPIPAALLPDISLIEAVMHGLQKL
jgi:hypothetical protein